MNGIEALQAMLEGKTVIYHRRADKKPCSSDSYYRYRTKHTYDHIEAGGWIWTRMESEWTWHICENPAEFWMRTSVAEDAERFDIVEGVE